MGGEGLRTPWERPVSARTVKAAIQLGRDYLLPHAQAAFQVMGADERAGHAAAVWKSIQKLCESSEYSESAPPRVARRWIHQNHRRRFPKAEEVDPVIDHLVELLPP